VSSVAAERRPRFILEIDVRQLLPAVVLHDEAGIQFLYGRSRKTTCGHKCLAGLGTSHSNETLSVIQAKGVQICPIKAISKNSKAAKVANNRAAPGRSAASSNGSPSKSPVSSPKVKRREAVKAGAGVGLRLSE
jgi:hypothetical protein